MPGRASTRSTRTSAAPSHKSSVSSLNQRESWAVYVDKAADTADNALRNQVVAVFRDAQRTTVAHRKLVVSLRKMQEACCYEPVALQGSNKSLGRALGDFSENEFNSEFVRCVTRVMPVKKAESAGEKTIRFVALFLRHAQEKDKEVQGDDDASTMAETPSSRLVGHVLADTSLPLLTAKDKYVRYRATQLIAHVVNSLDALDDDLFQKLRVALLRRIRDKEAMVRVQAVLGLARLAGNEVQAEDGDSDGSNAGTGLIERLLEAMQNDVSADVRRALLVNLPILPNTLPYLLERARDTDPLTRRSVYSRLLPALGDFRHLSLSMREKLLRWGLRDRDENVRKAAGRLFRERWIDDCVSTAQEAEAGPCFDGLLELLERIDVVNSGVENGVALEAMRGFWLGRPDYRDAVSFHDDFWETLSAESVFIARSFNDFCRCEEGGNYVALIEAKLPEVTRLAFYLERYIQALVDAIRRIDTQESGQDDELEDTAEQAFIVEQLLHMALTLDYTDEVGRRKMFALLRQTLSIPELPDDMTKLTVEVLRDLCAPGTAGEKEFCSVVLEAVADVHDTIVDDFAGNGDGDDESFHSARSEVDSDATPATDACRARNGADKAELTEKEAQDLAVKEMMINMKCLHMVQCMLANVAGSLQHNDHLVAMLNNLVVPAVRSHEAPVRERGLVCLGLCSLLNRSLAEENLTLFTHFFTKGHAALQTTALHILTDILMVHGPQLLANNPGLLRVYVKALRATSRAPEVQAAATLAVSKLLLGRVVTDRDSAAELLKTLVVTYFEPAGASNQSVRQALNYFLPVFCYARPDNQDLMCAVAFDALHILYNVRQGLADDDDADVDNDMASLSAIGACLVDWTDPRRCFSAERRAAAEDKRHVNGDVHLDFAAGVLARLAGNGSKDEKKMLAPLLGKLYVSPVSTEEKLAELYARLSAAVETQILADAAGRNALYKLHASLGRIILNLDAADAGARRSTSRASSVGTDDINALRASVSAVPHEVDITEEDEDAEDKSAVHVEGP